MAVTGKYTKKERELLIDFLDWYEGDSFSNPNDKSIFISKLIQQWSDYKYKQRTFPNKTK